MRLGIYGGTFSPPHNGHIMAAREFSSQMKLDRLLIIPANIPPHKEFDGKISPKDRLNMCRAAFCGIGEVSDIEIRRLGKSYTYDTLRELESLGHSDVYLLCGTDMLLSFDKWHRYGDILKMCSVVLAKRAVPSRDERQKIDETIRRLEAENGARIYELDLEPIEIASTQIREMIKAGEDVSDYMPAAEYEYIKEKGLYL